MPSYVVQGRDPRRVATAVVLYQLRQPRFALALAAALAAFAVVGAFSGWRGSVGGVAFALVVIVLVTEYKRRQLALQLARRGFRPGSTVDISADEDALTVTARTGTDRYPWTQVERPRAINGIVLFRVKEARFVVALPVDAMPADWRQRTPA